MKCINDLSGDVIARIFSFLSEKDRASAASVDQRFRHTDLSDKSFWKDLLTRTMPATKLGLDGSNNQNYRDAFYAVRNGALRARNGTLARHATPLSPENLAHIKTRYALADVRPQFSCVIVDYLMGLRQDVIETPHRRVKAAALSQKRDLLAYVLEGDTAVHVLRRVDAATSTRSEWEPAFTLGINDNRDPTLGHIDMVQAVAFSAKDSLLLTYAADRTVILWDLATHRVVRMFGEPIPDTLELEICHPVLSPCGRYLALQKPFTTIIWDRSTGERLHILQATGGKFSPDGSLLALLVHASISSLAARIYDVQSGAFVTMDGGLEHLLGFSFFTDGSLFLAHSRTCARIWCTASGALLQTVDAACVGRELTGFELVRFATDGQSLIICDKHKAVRVGWERKKPDPTFCTIL